MSPILSWDAAAIRLALAVVAGALIGMNRGEHAHTAGLRTNVMVCAAAALAMLMANAMYAHTPDSHNSVVRLDFMRLPLGILSGIGFIGAGAILRHGEAVRGLTTAATLWLVTVIGLCFGSGQIGLGTAGTALGLATLWLLKFVESGSAMSRRGTVSVTVRHATSNEGELLAFLQARGFAVRSRRIVHEPGGSQTLQCSGRYRGAFPGWSSELVQQLTRRPGVTRVVWHDID